MAQPGDIWNLKRLNRILFPTIVVVFAVSAFACGGHIRRQQQQAVFAKARIEAEAGPWLREAQSDGVQHSKATSRTVADNSIDLYQSDGPYGTFRNVYEPYMHTGGYSLAHVSNGNLFWKHGWSLQQIYFIYRRD